MADLQFKEADPYGPCFICRLIANKSTRPWFDVPVREMDGVAVALLGVGALAPGYLLVCPEMHVTSLAQLPPELHKDFLGFVQSIVDMLEEVFGPVVLFEHAGCRSEDSSSSACVAHAHLHVWAIGDRVQLAPPKARQLFDSLAAFLEAGPRFVSSPYLLAQNGDGPVQVGTGDGLSQYFRREVARQLNRPDEWDYGAFPMEPAMRETLEALSL